MQVPEPSKHFTSLLINSMKGTVYETDILFTPEPLQFISVILRQLSSNSKRHIFTSKKFQQLQWQLTQIFSADLLFPQPSQDLFILTNACQQSNNSKGKLSQVR